MTLSKDEVGVVYNKGDAKEVECKADFVNACNCLYLENNSGGSVTSGDVGFIGTGGKFSVGSAEGLKEVIVVVATNHDDTAQTIAAAEFGWFQVVARCPKVNVDAATAIGDWLVTSTTTKSAHPDSSALPPQGTFAMALWTTGGAGSVEAMLLPGFGWTDDEHRATTAAVHGLATDVELVGCLEGTVRMTYGSQSVDATASTRYTTTVNFTSTLPGEPQVVVPAVRKDDLNLDEGVGIRTKTESLATVNWMAGDQAGIYYVEVLAFYVG